MSAPLESFTVEEQHAVFSFLFPEGVKKPVEIHLQMLKKVGINVLKCPFDMRHTFSL